MTTKKSKENRNKDEEELRKNPINVFTCGACKNSAAVPFEEFKKHLMEVHKLKEDQLKAKRKMIMHMDGDYWYSSTYEWTMEIGLKFQQHTQNATDKDDPMRFGD